MNMKAISEVPTQPMQCLVLCGCGEVLHAGSEIPLVRSKDKRNYAKALDDLFQFCASRPLSRSLLMEWRAAMESLSPSTINVRLSAVRKLVGEARRAGMIGQEEAARL
ncbi:hypothetical protein [Tunturiibacter gelidiferens]|uniref:hypothetical protein n=1 Tax=Tunturiibacter gelidiferens TaxID=3069689 RepID=UPI003D9B9DCB